MNFTYFRGPEIEMAHLSRSEETCALCGKTGRGFGLDFADCEELFPTARALPAVEGLKTDRREGRYGCHNCLRVGRFEFSHWTEVGVLLAPQFLQQYPDLDLPLPPESFPESAISELRRTPQFTTWQGEECSPWLVHCNDFMVYQGSWMPADFQRHAPNGDGRDLFREMTSPKQAVLWDMAAQDRGERHPTDWYATYYAFRCRHCGKLRGQWDNP